MEQPGGTASPEEEVPQPSREVAVVEMESIGPSSFQTDASQLAYEGNSNIAVEKVSTIHDECEESVEPSNIQNGSSQLPDEANSNKSVDNIVSVLDECEKSVELSNIQNCSSHLVDKENSNKSVDKTVNSILDESENPCEQVGNSTGPKSDLTNLFSPVNNLEVESNIVENWLGTSINEDLNIESPQTPKSNATFNVEPDDLSPTMENITKTKRVINETIIVIDESLQEVSENIENVPEIDRSSPVIIIESSEDEQDNVGFKNRISDVNNETFASCIPEVTMESNLEFLSPENVKDVSNNLVIILSPNKEDVQCTEKEPQNSTELDLAAALEALNIGDDKDETFLSCHENFEQSNACDNSARQLFKTVDQMEVNVKDTNNSVQNHSVEDHMLEDTVNHSLLEETENKSVNSNSTDKTLNTSVNNLSIQNNLPEDEVNRSATDKLLDGTRNIIIEENEAINEATSNNPPQNNLLGLNQSLNNGILKDTNCYQEQVNLFQCTKSIPKSSEDANIEVNIKGILTTKIDGDVLGVYKNTSPASLKVGLDKNTSRESLKLDQSKETLDVTPTRRVERISTGSYTSPEVSVLSYSSLMQASPSLFDQQASRYEKQSGLKLRINELEQAVARLKLQLRQKEGIIMKMQLDKANTAKENEKNALPIDILRDRLQKCEHELQITKTTIHNMRSRHEQEVHLIEMKLAEQEFDFADYLSRTRELEAVTMELKRCEQKNFDMIIAVEKAERDKIKALQSMEHYEIVLMNITTNHQYLKKTVNDLTAKLEHAKEVIHGLKNNEDVYKKNQEEMNKKFKNFNEQYEFFKKQAAAKIDEANKENIRLNQLLNPEKPIVGRKIQGRK